MLGLFAFFYACLHLLTYVWLDKFFAWPEIARDIPRRPFITIGFLAFVVLVPLAATSTAGMIRRLGGRAWQRLHRLIYVSAIAGVVHFWWLVKADISVPRLYAVVLGVLLLARLVVAVRRAGRPTWLARSASLRLRPRDDRGQQRQEDHHRDDVVDALLEVGDRPPEEEAGQAHRRDPQDGADDVVGGEAPVRHVGSAGDDGRERADDRHELREDDRLAAVPLVELVRADEVLAPEQQRVRTAVERVSRLAPDEVAGGVADDGGDDQARDQRAGCSGRPSRRRARP